MNPILLLMAIFLSSCSHQSKHDRHISLQQGYDFQQKLFHRAIQKIKSDLFTPNSYSEIYASFGNVDFFYGEKLKIKMLLIGSLKFDGKVSQIVALNSDMYEVKNAPFGLDSFSSMTNIPTTLYEIHKPVVIGVNLLVEGENFNQEIIRTNFVVRLYCQGKPCEFHSYQQAMNFLSGKKYSSVSITVYKESVYDVANFHFKDPISKYREKPYLLSRIYKRLVWRGMNKDVFKLYGINEKTGSFGCQVSKLCDSGYEEITLSTNKVESFKFYKNKRRERR